MAITPYRPATDPFTPMVEDFLRPLAGWGGRMGNLLQAPHADVVERENEIRVTVELPGMEAGDIDVNLETICSPSAARKRKSVRKSVTPGTFLSAATASLPALSCCPAMWSRTGFRPASTTAC